MVVGERTRRTRELELSSGFYFYADALVEASDLAAWWKRMRSAMPPAVVGDKRPLRAKSRRRSRGPDGGGLQTSKSPGS